MTNEKWIVIGWPTSGWQIKPYDDQARNSNWADHFKVHDSYWSALGEKLGMEQGILDAYGRKKKTKKK